MELKGPKNWQKTNFFIIRYIFKQQLYIKKNAKLFRKQVYMFILTTHKTKYLSIAQEKRAHTLFKKYILKRKPMWQKILPRLLMITENGQGKITN